MKNKKIKVHFVCQSCGYESPRWLGRCSECGAWNSLVEEKIPEVKGRQTLVEKPPSRAVALSDIDFQEDSRFLSRSEEFNRVLGGGIVPGSVVLVGGDPGIGKSTLMLQEGANLATEAFKILYVSGEESMTQTKLRAKRLGIDSEHLLILAETNLEAILESVERINPGLLVIDSIQTVYRPEFESAPGSISQVRECALQFLNLAKTKNIPVFLIGHVTKEGYIAGPKVLEHMVDTLLYFEGDKDHFYRILRAVKNRFGSTNEIGVFEMTERGLQEVRNPSEIFLSQRKEDIPGSTVICTMEGTRPILVEIQALVSPSNFGLPQRTTTGVDAKRLALLLAVLEKRVGLRIGTFDVFVNAVGGVKIDETSADLGILVAIASSLKNQLVDPKAIVVGEVGLGGEIRAVSQIERRIGEAEKLGFSRCILPQVNVKALGKKFSLEIQGVEKVSQALEMLLK
ncbi:MAG: DNA repair protein RadA [candidate division KSB1 bacterium]|nr:DNA repair protein RadA [candidate division KSB1 bacterium]